jgi:hypothetical protein
MKTYSTVTASLQNEDIFNTYCKISACLFSLKKWIEIATSFIIVDQNQKVQRSKPKSTNQIY